MLRTACMPGGGRRAREFCQAIEEEARRLRTLRPKPLQALPQDLGALQRCGIRVLPPAVCGRVVVHSALVRWPCSKVSHGVGCTAWAAASPAHMHAHLAHRRSQ